MTEADLDRMATQAEYEYSLILEAVEPEYRQRACAARVLKDFGGDARRIRFWQYAVAVTPIPSPPSTSI